MRTITAELLRGLALPEHDSGASKEGRGQILIVGGCLSVPGAILLSAEGAMRAGAGKLQIATCRSVAPHLGLAVPEAMVIALPESDGGGIASHAGEVLAKHAARADTVLIGPGMMEAENTVPVVAALLESAGEQTGFVFDAGALTRLHEVRAHLHQPGRASVITPHSGEMAKLLDIPRDAIDADPLPHARQAAEHLRCTVVLKGGDTVVAAPDGEAWRFQGGTIGLATSGSGDVLAGIIAGLMARGAAAATAAIWGVFLHAHAGRRLERRYGHIGLLARELPREVPALMAEMAGAPVMDAAAAGR